MKPRKRLKPAAPAWRPVLQELSFVAQSLKHRLLPPRAPRDVKGARRLVEQLAAQLQDLAQLLEGQDEEG